MESVQIISQERFSECIDEQIAEVMEQTVDVPMLEVAEGIVEPQMLDEVVDTIQVVPQDRNHHRI